MGSSIWSSKEPTCEPSSTSLVVSAAATTRPVSASTPIWSLRHDRRRLVPCFSTNHSPAPHSFNEIVYRPIYEMKPDPANARQHSKKQLLKLAKSIETFGFNVPVLVD